MTFKKWLIVAAALFIIGIIFGLFAPADFISEEIADLEETAEGLLDLPVLAILVFILFRNLMSFLVSFTLSPIFLLAPVTALVLNGWILGAVSVEVAGVDQNRPCAFGGFDQGSVHRRPLLDPAVVRRVQAVDDRAGPGGECSDLVGRGCIDGDPGYIGQFRTGTRPVGQRDLVAVSGQKSGGTGPDGAGAQNEE